MPGTVRGTQFLTRRTSRKEIRPHSISKLDCIYGRRDEGWLVAAFKGKENTLGRIAVNVSQGRLNSADEIITAPVRGRLPAHEEYVSHGDIQPRRKVEREISTEQ